jgi:hypothetical protein
MVEEWSEAERHTRHGVEVARNSEHMQTLNECVVQDEHDGSEPPRPSLVPEQHLRIVLSTSR